MRPYESSSGSDWSERLYGHPTGLFLYLKRPRPRFCRMNGEAAEGATEAMINTNPPPDSVNSVFSERRIGRIGDDISKFVFLVTTLVIFAAGSVLGEPVTTDKTPIHK